MAKETRGIGQSFVARAIGSALALGAVLVVTACARPRVWVNPGPTHGGLSQVQGWGGAFVDIPVTGTFPNYLVRAGENSGRVEEVKDINGQVGHPLSVSRPTAYCLPGGAWGGTPVVVSGELPRGLSLASDGEIRGIPEERGHWIVTLAMTNLTCLGASHGRFQQQLRFHITGSGRVIQ